jgi:hypothetical protein
MNEAQNVVIKAVIYAIEKADPTLKNLLEFHLKSTTGKGFELAYENPEEFKRSVSKLFGEYSGRLLEMLIIGYFKENVGLKGDVNNLEELVVYLKKIYGE